MDGQEVVVEVSGRKVRARHSVAQAAIAGDARPIAVWECVAQQARATPHALAIAAACGAMTYAELAASAGRCAQRLERLGAGPDALVGLCLPRSAALVFCALGILESGAAYLALDPAWPPERIAWMLRDAGAALLIANSELAAALPSKTWQWLTPEAVSAGSAADTTGVSPAGRAVAAGALATESLAYVIYTSGSTGQPKGVEITHANLANLISWHLRAFAITAADRASLIAAPGFDASVWETWPYLAAGASLHIPSEADARDPERLRDFLLAERVTVAFAPTPLAERLLRLAWPAQAPLRLLLTGADTLHRCPPAGLPFALVNNYGPTECAVVATSGQVAPAASANAAELPSIGKEIDLVQVYVLDEYCRPVAAGEAGELYIGGAGVGRGYRRRPVETAARFVPDPFSPTPDTFMYRTGDLGRRLPDGQLAFLGRVDEQVKIRGYRIEPEEIAAQLAGHPAIEASAVIASADGGGEKQLVAYVVAAPAVRTGSAAAEPAAELTAEQLRGYLRARLPQYMIPAKFVRLAQLPMTANGKLDRTGLPPPHAADLLPVGPSQPPRTPVEEQLAIILCALLEVERIGASDNFFHLGGHSLLGAQVIARVRHTFGVDLPLRSVFDYPTVEAMAGEIERLVMAKIESLNPQAPAGSLGEVSA